MTRWRALLLVLICGAASDARAATCSCAGVPLLGFIDTFAVERGELYLTYASEFHQIDDLVSGTTDVRDETGRDRSTFSQVLTGSYAITDRWAVSALVSYVEHERRIGISKLGGTETSGLGDSVVMARYTPKFITPFSRHQWSLGLGARIPTGEDTAGGGFIESEDMQPSTGAWGTIAWSNYQYAFNQAATMKLDVSASYTSNQENRRDYSFGDEVIFATAFSHNLGTRFSYSAGLRYRHTDPDERFGFQVPNTGGQWVDFVPAVQVSLTDRLSLGLSGRLPLWRDLEGALQFTTSYAYSLSLTYGL